MQIKIPKIKLEEEMGRGAQSIVYRGVRESKNFAVKVFSSAEKANSGGRRRFLREAEALARTKHIGLPNVMEVGEIESVPYVVMEYIEGRTLADELKKGVVSEASLLEMAKVLATALHEIHSINLIHRDVKPGNIILDTNDNAWLVDFGLAANLQKDDNETGVGTYLYRAPEQTGMLKRPVDTRSDLYSLGVVLFECAAGKPPYYSEDANELIRLHISSQVPRLNKINPSLSPALSKVIEKLLNKDPDDRYQTSRGLLEDLLDLDNLNKALKEGKDAVFDSYDIYGAEIPYETLLVGRKQELSMLRDEFDRAKNGIGSVVLVEGAPGMGKTRLCFEFINEMLKKKALVLNGKCVESNPVPFSSIKALMEEYARYLDKLPQGEKNKEQERLRDIIGSFGPILKNFSPFFSALLKGEKEVKIENAHELVQEGLAHVLLNMARAHKGLILFIDDLQWLDESSEQALRKVINNCNAYPVMIMLSGRSDPDNKEKIEYFLSRTGDVLSRRIVLEGLDAERISEYICSYLETKEVNKQLVEALVARGEGNPFATAEYLRAMLDAGLLLPYWGSWKVDLAGLEKLYLPKNILELALRRISDLGKKTKAVLVQCAVIGEEFEVGYLPEICGASLEEIYAAIAEAYRAHVIERIGSKYRFVHDRLQEGLIKDLAEDDRKKSHRKIAEVFERLNGQSVEHIYALARHYSLGMTEDNAQRVYTANLKAGLTALENFVPLEACGFFAVAHKLAPGPDFALEKNYGIACFQVGRMDEAVMHFNQALALTEDKFEHVDIRVYLSAVHMADIRVDEAMEELKKGFAKLRKPYPKSNIFSLLKSLGVFLLWNMLDRLHIFYGCSKGKALRTRQAETQLLNQLSRSSYFKFNPIIVLQITFRMLYLAHLVGDSRETSFIYTNFALMLLPRGKEKGPRECIRKTNEVAKRINDPPAIDRALYSIGAQEVYLDHLARGVEKLRVAYHHSAWLDEQDYGNMITMFFWALYLTGNAYESIEVGEKHLQILERKAEFSSIPVDTRLMLNYACLASTYLYIEKIEEAEKCFAKMIDIAKKGGWKSVPPIFRGIMFVCAFPYLIEKEETGPRLDGLLKEIPEFELAPFMTDYTFRWVYVYQCNALLMKCRKSEKPDLKPLIRALSVLRSVDNPWPSHMASRFIIEAALKNLQGRHKEALRFLYKAEEIAQDVDAIQIHINIFCEKARTFNALKNACAGKMSAQEAYDMARRYGWTRKCNQIRKEFHLESSTGTTALEYMVDQKHKMPLDTSSLRLQRYLDALLKMSLASAAVLDPEQQIRSALDEIVRILGAEKAYLFLCDKDDQLELQAARDASRKDVNIKSDNFIRGVALNVKEKMKALVINRKGKGSILAVPMVMKDKLIGVIYLSNHLAKDVFTNEDVEILVALSNHIAIALESARTVQVELERKALEKVKIVLEEKVKERTAELKETYEKLAVSEKLAALGKLAGAIGHELRNPLAVIKGAEELLSLKTMDKPDEKIKQYLDMIASEADKANTIINDILTYARVRTDDLKPVNVESSIAGVLKRIDKPANIQVAIKADKASTVMASEVQLEQVFSNLIQNAYQA
ncbi:MAG: protein kinase, partial [Candidatus Margulisbacteria bacterium]|nr:protein kinase [Candidatus Margulisiibacteriota bacterium]